jgi:hypothetical protein
MKYEYISGNPECYDLIGKGDILFTRFDTHQDVPRDARIKSKNRILPTLYSLIILNCHNFLKYFFPINT